MSGKKICTKLGWKQKYKVFIQLGNGTVTIRTVMRISHFYIKKCLVLRFYVTGPS